MLEVKWKDACLRTSSLLFICFNPCYVGSKMESLDTLVQIQLRPRFNPCYVGSKMERLNTLFLFSDFFSFNPCYVGSKMESSSSISFFATVFCFNPCYVGSKMESIEYSPLEEALSKFQSLLCWK